MDIRVQHIHKNSPLSCLTRSGLLAITDVLLDGIGRDGFGWFCMAAKACCTASCLTSLIAYIKKWERNKLKNVLKK